LKNRSIPSIIIALLAVVIVSSVCLYRPLYLPFERKIYDLKYQWHITEQRIEDIVIVDIDEKSLEKLGRYQNWPRAYFAEVIDYLDNARVIGFDIFFAEPDTLPVIARQYFSKPNFDTLIDRALKKNRMVVLVSDLETKPIFTQYNATGYGYIFADDDGVVRKGFYSIFQEKTFAAQVADMAGSDNREQEFLIDYSDAGSFRRISFSDIYLKRVPKEYFKDKIILVGGSAAGLFDYHAVPFNRHFPGIMIQANIVNNFIKNLKINEIPYIYIIIASFILCLITSLFYLSTRARIFIIISIILGVLIIGSSIILFGFKYDLGIIRILYAFALTIVLTLIYRYQFAEREKRKIKAIFSRYYSQDIVEKLVEHPPVLGGEKAHCTVLFADIRNFTPYAEKTNPEDVGNRLNAFLDEMVRSIFAYQGSVDKFIGDCVMAVFGTPVKLRNHAYNACLAALEMVKKAEKLGFRIGIGINSGEVISGNFGSPMRMEYTVIGDPVNLASRLEGVTKQFDCSIVLGPDTYHLAMTDPTEYMKFTELGKVKVKGKQEEIMVYTVSTSISESALPSGGQ
jgi:adenylate cyclase